MGVCAVFLLMACLWSVQRRTRNAGIVDLGWTISIFLMALFCYGTATGDPLKRSAMFLMVFLWALRLLRHLTRRFIRESKEDARYNKWRQAQGDKADTFFLFVFFFQGALAAVLSAPFWIVSFDPSPGFEPAHYAGLFLWIAAFLGESLADRQLTRFKSDPANRSKVCEAGLWNYSRHPNYFFECLIWVSYFIFALDSPGGYWALLSPALMIFFIVKISGLPPAEQQSLLSKGESYRVYQRTTSPLIPWFKKKP